MVHSATRQERWCAGRGAWPAPEPDCASSGEDPGDAARCAALPGARPRGQALAGPASSRPPAGAGPPPPLPPRRGPPPRAAVGRAAAARTRLPQAHSLQRAPWPRACAASRGAASGCSWVSRAGDPIPAPWPRGRAGAASPLLPAAARSARAPGLEDARAPGSGGVPAAQWGRGAGGLGAGQLRGTGARES